MTVTTTTIPSATGGGGGGGTRTVTAEPPPASSTSERTRLSLALKKQRSAGSILSRGSSGDSLLKAPTPSSSGRKSPKPKLLKSPNVQELRAQGDTRSQSLDTPDSCPSVRDVRRASLAVGSRSKSLNAPCNSTNAAAAADAEACEPQPIVVAPGASSADSLPGSSAGTASASNTLIASIVGTCSGGSSLSLPLSLPQLIMMSNLQNFFGAKNARKPSIQPNEYMDGLIATMKADMKERYCA